MRNLLRTGKEIFIVSLFGSIQINFKYLLKDETKIAESKSWKKYIFAQSAILEQISLFDQKNEIIRIQIKKYRTITPNVIWKLQLIFFFEWNYSDFQKKFLHFYDYQESVFVYWKVIEWLWILKKLFSTKRGITFRYFQIVWTYSFPLQEYWNKYQFKSSLHWFIEFFIADEEFFCRKPFQIRISAKLWPKNKNISVLFYLIVNQKAWLSDYSTFLMKKRFSNQLFQE